VLTWVYEDPETRAAEGRTRVAELARQATGAALREIQDVGTMLARLAGSVKQFAGIAEQVTDLAGWENELRGKDGRWVKSGTISSQASKPASPRVTAETVDVIKAHAAAAAAEMAGTLRAEHAAIVHEILDKVDETNKKLAETQAAHETAAKHSARVRLAVEGGVAVAGALLAMALAAVGVAPMIAVAAALGSTAVTLITEYAQNKKV
jgi:hypothetical protein